MEVFRDSRFEIRSKSEGGCIDVQLSLATSSGSVRAEEERNRLATAASLRPLLEPRAVAIVGASRDLSSIGRRVLDAVMAAGFNGPVYAVNPNSTEIAGLRSYGSVATFRRESIWPWLPSPRRSS
jgi:acetate---CoA ligase (ADP-forming)